MNRKKETYDRIAVGERIQMQRQCLGMSQEELAERIDRATKYCSDIERGMCGMSVETMLAFSEQLNMSLDYMMYGKNDSYEASNKNPVPKEFVHLMEHCSEQQYTYALRLLEIFLEATSV